MFVVMNRLSNENVVEAVCADFQMELTDQFLLYRNDKHEINGIWCGRAASTCAARTHPHAARPPYWCDVLAGSMLRASAPPSPSCCRWWPRTTAPRRMAQPPSALPPLCLSD